VSKNEAQIGLPNLRDNSQDNGPSVEYEKYRRKLFSDIKDLKYYLNSEIDALHTEKSNYFKESTNHRLKYLIISLFSYPILTLN
jgi:hypothetical protein